MRYGESDDRPSPLKSRRTTEIAAARARQLVLCGHAHHAAWAARGDVRDLLVLPRGRRHRRRPGTGRGAAGKARRAGGGISTRSICGEKRPDLAGLATAVRAFKLDSDDFRAIIDGMEMDVKQKHPGPRFRGTRSLLRPRGKRRGAAVRRACSGIPQEDGRQLSEHLGRALQLTNILRDLDEDAGISRLYLPREFLNEAGIATTDPAAVLAHPALPEVCGRIVALARWHFAEADKVMKRHPRRKVRTPRVMAEAYKSILKALVSRGWAAPRAAVKLEQAPLGFDPPAPFHFLAMAPPHPIPLPMGEGTP